jgi:hypothetical protein
MPKLSRSTLIALAAVLAIAAAFYWYAWRPQQIRKTCALRANPERFDNIPYDDCLHQNGLDH